MKGIYSINNSMDGSMYIGSASFLSQRKSRHMIDLQQGIYKNPYLQNAYNKYGKASFDFNILEEIDDFEGLVPQEQYWINLARGLKINLYNITLKAGSNLGLRFGKRDPSVGQKISLAIRGNKNKLGFRKSFCIRGHIRNSATVYSCNHGCIICKVTKDRIKRT